jgi:S-(hydroxymethyl)glutathione dehydrogenase / alcohol dehydrogenase
MKALVYHTRIISHHMKLDEAPRGYEMFDKKEDITKVVFTS